MSGPFFVLQSSVVSGDFPTLESANDFMRDLPTWVAAMVVDYHMVIYSIKYPAGTDMVPGITEIDRMNEANRNEQEQVRLAG